MKSKELSDYLNSLLEIARIRDASLNGLQVENDRDITRIGLAVDVSRETIEKAHEEGADFLIVHHGLFWDRPEPITGILFHRIRALIKFDIALYAAHLPLDIHPEFGNNTQIKHALGWPVAEDFGMEQGMVLGKKVLFDPGRKLSEVVDDLRKALNIEPKVWNFGSDLVHKLGYISGGGLGFLSQAVEAGLDTLVTGEPRHGAYWPAKEAGINVILAGHYATETLGVKALGRHIQDKYGIEAVFLDCPTGY